MLKTLLAGGILVGEHIVLNPKADGKNQIDGKDDNNLAHTTAIIMPNTREFAAAFYSSGTDQVNNHTRLLALLAPGLAVRPWTWLSPTVDMKRLEQAMQMWTWAQFGCGRAIADLVAEGVIPKDLAESLLISLQVFIHPAADNNEAIFQCQYEATWGSVSAAFANKQTVELMLENRTKAVHGLCKDEKGEVYTPAAIQALIDAVHKKAA